MSLVIVESPAKAKKIQSFLKNDNIIVRSSFGHINGLDTTKLEKMISAVGLMKFGVVDAVEDGIALQETFEDKLLKAAEESNHWLEQLALASRGPQITAMSASSMS